MNNYKRTIVSFAVTLLLSGCAVNRLGVEAVKTEKLLVTDAAIAQMQTQQKQERSLNRIDSNYLGSKSIEIPAEALLPDQFFERIQIRASGMKYGTVADAARNINLATRIQVRINEDAQQAPGASSESSGEASSAKPVRLDYDGTLLSYVRNTANASGLEWSYTDGTIHFFRLVSKTFILSNASPLGVEVASSMQTGGAATTGQTGGQGGSGTSGGFSSTSSINVKGSYNVWTLFKAQLQAAITAEGKLEINEATGTIFVKDSKESVANIEKMVKDQNAILARQVAISVRVIRVDVNESAEAGVNLNAVYQLLNTAGTVATGAPSSLASAAAGSFSFAMNDPTSRLNGTTAAVTALNSLGTVVSDTNSGVVTRNRIPAMSGAFKSRGFLAQTTPAAGGGLGGSAGIPGLVPGSVTTGSFLRILPTILENNTVLLDLSVDLSDFLGFDSASTGSGETLQQIQWANTSGNKTISSLLLNQDQSMVMVGLVGNLDDSSTASGIGGKSRSATKSKSIFVIVVTPRIMSGI